MSVYKLTLQTLCPLHIGDGVELRQEFEYKVFQGKTYRLDEDAILEAMAGRVQRERDGSYPTPGSLLSETDMSNPRFFRYILRGGVRSERAYASVRSFIKDHQDRPYVPGSSVKGALRTALAWTGFTEVNPRVDRASLGRNRSWVGQPLERKLFGPDPNHDLLRTLHVSDLFGPQEPGGGMLVVNAQVMTLRGPGAPIELEVVPGGVTFEGSLTIDETLFRPWAEQELGFSNRRPWLDQLMQRAQKHSAARIQSLVTQMEKYPNNAGVAKFYRDLAANQLAANQAMIQVGWGAGWDAKTFWTHLKKDKIFFEGIIADFKLQRRPKEAPPRRPGAAFPASRRVAMVVRQGVAQAVAPFGWALVTLEKER